MQTNLVVRSLTANKYVPIGKTVMYRNRQIVHDYVYPTYQRYTMHAWGVRYPLARWMDREGVRDIYFWDNENKITYHIELDAVKLLGVPGTWDQLGGTLNVPVSEWEVIGHKLRVAWVPDEDQIILPPCDEPWPIAVRMEEIVHPHPSPLVRRQRQSLISASLQPPLF